MYTWSATYDENYYHVTVFSLIESEISAKSPFVF